MWRGAARQREGPLKEMCPCPNCAHLCRLSPSTCRLQCARCLPTPAGTCWYCPSTQHCLQRCRRGLPLGLLPASYTVHCCHCVELIRAQFEQKHCWWPFILPPACHLPGLLVLPACVNLVPVATPRLRLFAGPRVFVGAPRSAALHRGHKHCRDLGDRCAMHAVHVVLCMLSKTCSACMPVSCHLAPAP
jgi:hypothetical protein